MDNTFPLTTTDCGGYRLRQGAFLRLAPCALRLAPCALRLAPCALRLWGSKRIEATLPGKKEGKMTLGHIAGEYATSRASPYGRKVRHKRISVQFILIILTYFVRLSAVVQASSPPNPMNCSASPFPVDGNGFLTIPFTESSTRFPMFHGTNNYQNNTDYKWQAWFSGNVVNMRFVFSNFSTEFFDKFSISNLNTVNVSGQPAVPYVSNVVVADFSTYAADNFVNLEWSSDYSVNYSGWTISSLKVGCGGYTDKPAATASNVSRLHFNDQRDGVLLGTGDIRYFATLPGSGTPPDHSMTTSAV